MSVSDNSTVAGSRDHDGTEQLLEAQSYGDGDLTPVVFWQSPYADTEIISLHVGPDSTRFDVHNTILCRSSVLLAKFDARNVTKQNVQLPEIDEATAHTLVHYLYTNTYQALRVPQQIEKGAAQAYKLGTCVYCAAVRYQLPGLAELAKEKITSFGEDVGISEILSTARDHAFPVLPESEAWYPEYLEGAVKSAMKNDPETFRRPDFISQVEGNSRLLQLVWKTMMSSHANLPVVTEAKEQVEVPEEQVLKEEPVEVLNQDVGQSEVASSIDVPDKQPEEAKIASPEPVAEPDNQIPPVSASLDDGTYKLDEIEPIVEPTAEKPLAPEPFTDELGYGGSKTYKKMGQVGKKNEVDTEKEAVLSVPERSGHKRSDSVMQTEQADVSVESVKDEDEAVLKTDAAPLIVNGSSEAPAVSKKSKKSKKKKNSITF